jgi:hypothetical protein
VAAVVALVPQAQTRQEAVVEQVVIVLLYLENQLEVAEQLNHLYRLR